MVKVFLPLRVIWKWCWFKLAGFKEADFWHSCWIGLDQEQILVQFQIEAPEYLRIYHQSSPFESVQWWMIWTTLKQLMWLPFLFQVFQQVYPDQRCQRLHWDLRKSWWCIGCSHSSSMHPLPNQPSLFPCCDWSCNQISYAIAVHLLQYLYWISSWLSFLSICWRKPN